MPYLRDSSTPAGESGDATGRAAGWPGSRWRRAWSTRSTSSNVRRRRAGAASVCRLLPTVHA